MSAAFTSTARRIHPATPATVRHVNRAIVLNLVRRHQPISRVRLSELTGIYRSSISEIVDELITQGLLLERLSEPMGRGRVPIQLTLNPAGYRVLGVSVRPFQSFVAIAGLSGKIERSTSFRTPKKPAQLMRELLRTVEHFRANDPGEATEFQHVGIGVPGMVNAANGVISIIPSLPDYAGFDIAGEVQRQFGVPVLVDNDCNIGALAELWLNPVEIAQLHDFVFLEIGDVGVGAGIVVRGALYQGYDSTWVGEFGHMVVDPSGPPCRCGRRGCWERFVSDEATWKRFDSSRPYSPDNFDELIRLAKEERDAKALKAIRQTAEYLSLGISNILCSLNSQMVLVSGEITKVWTLVEDIVRKRWASPSLNIRIRPALMPLDQLSLQGAIALALSNHFGAPKLG